ILDQLVRFPALEVGDEADAASIVFAARIEEPARAWTSRRGIRPPPARCRIRFNRHGLAFRVAFVPPQGCRLARGSALPHRAPKRGGNKPSLARSRTPPLRGPPP